MIFSQSFNKWITYYLLKTAKAQSILHSNNCIISKLYQKLKKHMQFRQRNLAVTQHLSYCDFYQLAGVCDGRHCLTCSPLLLNFLHSTIYIVGLGNIWLYLVDQISVVKLLALRSFNCAVCCCEFYQHKNTMAQSVWSGYERQHHCQIGRIKH